LCTFAVSVDYPKKRIKSGVKTFDKHKICVTILISATILKGGDPVSRVILESGVGTVMGGVF
jgi:hypothetical protein